MSGPSSIVVHVAVAPSLIVGEPLQLIAHKTRLCIALGARHCDGPTSSIITSTILLSTYTWLWCRNICSGAFRYLPSLAPGLAGPGPVVVALNRPAAPGRPGAPQNGDRDGVYCSDKGSATSRGRNGPEKLFRSDLW